MRLAFLVTTLSFVIANTAFSITIYIDGQATGIVNDGANWCDAYLTLQDALVAAEASGGAIDEIRVADGTYKPDQGSAQTLGNRTATFQLLNGVTITGGYAGCGAVNPDARDITTNETILSGDLAGNDFVVPTKDLVDELTRTENSYHVVTGSLTDATATLVGFTIKGGNANKYTNNSYFGGGMYTSNGSPTLTNCVFTENSAKDDGGGVYNTNSSPTFTNCDVISNSSNSSGGGMYNSESNPLLTNCTFRENTAKSGGGIYNFRSCPTITSCDFRRNAATNTFNVPGSGGGMHNEYHSEPIITSCIFTGNTGLHSGGMINRNDSHPKVINCSFFGNSATDDDSAGGIYIDSYSTATVSNCILWGNFPREIQDFQNLAVVTFSDVLGGYPGEGNIDFKPLFFNADAGNLRVQSESPCIDSGNNDVVPTGVVTDLVGELRFVDHVCVDDTGNGPAPIVDMGAYEFQQPVSCGNGVCNPDETCETCACDCGNCCGDNVCTNYESCLTCPDDCPCQTILVPGNYDKIQDAIAASLEGDDIVVAPGTYFESLNFLGKAFTLRSSHGPSVTTIDATGLNNSVITCVLGEDTNTTIEGFTITGGTADNGGGMHILHSSPIVNNCIFIENSANEYGGGMYNGINTQPKVANCQFIRNNANYTGGGIHNFQSKPKITNCEFYGNRTNSSGGGMANRTSYPTVTNCIFYGNYANYSGGGIQNSNGLPTISNCTFCDNVANNYGGGMDNESSDPMVLNCTFTRNSALYGDGISNRNYSDTAITNCILWLNTPLEIYKSDDSAVTVSYTNIKYGYIGQGNINAAPKFIRSPTFGLDRVWGTDDDDYGDLRLQPSSPSINTGDPAIVFTTGETDIHGLPRVLCGQVDMGAHEFAGDYDCNLKLDLKDVAGFQTCFTGKNQGPYNSGCESMDFDGDLGIDRQDFTLFEQVFSPIPKPPRP